MPQDRCAPLTNAISDSVASAQEAMRTDVKSLLMCSLSYLTELLEEYLWGYLWELKRI